jgi:anti-sigma28 factor (negative regulator of flagellin synthesis)
MFTSHKLTGTSVPQHKRVKIQLQDEAKVTTRMFTSHNLTGTSVPQEKLVYTNNYDIAKPTIKQSTLINEPVANLSNNTSNYSRDNNDIAKITSRQQTEITQHIGSIKNNINDSNYVIDNNYIAKPTVKQTTVAPTPLGREFNSEMGNYTRDNKDIAKNTIRQTTEITEYVGSVRSDIENKISHDATDNIKLDDRRQISTYNRPANGKKDLHGPYINRENVELNNSLLYSYVPNPHISLDQSIMPSVPRDLVEKIYIKAKPVVETSSYYINDCFINTLTNNPLVNDIYHQKNIEY